VINVRRVFGFEKVGYFLKEGSVSPKGTKQRANLPVRIPNDFGRPLLVPFLHAEFATNAFERMTKWSVAEVVKQSGNHRNVSSLLIEFRIRDLAPNNIEQLPGNVKNTNAVGETSMCGTRVDELRYAELANTPKPLKLWRSDKTPSELISIVAGPEGN